MISHEGDAGKWILIFSTGILSHCAREFCPLLGYCAPVLLIKAYPNRIQKYLRLQNVPNVHGPVILNLNLKRHFITQT
jgi:hypothetical protein